MHVTCLQENLAGGLQVAKQKTRHTTLPILNNFLIKAERGALTVTSTDLELGIKSIIRGRIEDEGSITIPQDKLISYIKHLPGEKVDLELSEETLTVKSGEEFSAQFHGMNSEEFPDLPQFEAKHVLQLDRASFVSALKKASICLAKTNARPEIAGVYLSLHNGVLYLVGSDGFRLSEKQLRLDTEAPEGFSALIPTHTVQELIRILDAQEDEALELSFSDSQVMASLSTTEVISKLLEATFPQYDALIPQDFAYRVAFQKEDLRQAIQLAAVFSTDASHIIRLSFDPEGGLEVKSSQSEVGQNTSRIPVQLELGEQQPFEIMFHYQYLLDGLSAFDGEHLTFSFNDPDSAAVMRDSEDNSLLYLVMPLRE